MGSESGKNLGEANESGQCLVFAHRSSDHHWGWQIIKRVNQGKPGNGQGKRGEQGWLLHTSGRALALRRRGCLATAPDQRSFSSRRHRAGGRRWHTEHCLGAIACTRWEVLHQIPQRALRSSPALCKGHGLQPGEPVHHPRAEAAARSWRADATV